MEDNPANVTFMKDLVSAFANIGLLTAPTAETGSDLTRGRQPEVIIMDIEDAIARRRGVRSFREKEFETEPLCGAISWRHRTNRLRPENIAGIV